jgi:hypothetical protein
MTNASYKISSKKKICYRQFSENRIRELQQQLAEMQFRLVDAREKPARLEIR